MTFRTAYFLVSGTVLIALGLALLTDFRKFGTYWEDRLNERSAMVNRFMRLPWPHNPATGRVYRPFVGAAALLLGLAMVGLALGGAYQ